MLVCFSFARPDQDLALKNLDWIRELGAGKKHEILIVVPSGVTAPTAEKAMATARAAFEKATLYHLPDDCNTGWPYSANFMWKRAVDYIEAFHPGQSFLWCEPDAVFLCAGALDVIEDAYAKCGKRFMGFLAQNTTTGAHMNGVGVWRDVSRYASTSLRAPYPQEQRDVAMSPRMAFDMAGGDEVLLDFCNSRLFQFAYRKEDELLKDETLCFLNPDAVMFHTCKDERIFDLLRKKDGMEMARGFPPTGEVAGVAQLVEQRPPRPRVEGSLPSASAAPTFDLFIKTYPEDLQWLAYTLESILKYCNGFGSLRLLYEGREHDFPCIEQVLKFTIPCATIWIPTKSNGYLHQQVCKLNADTYTDAAFILVTDSDTIFTMPVTPETYLRDGKVIWLYTPFAGALEQEGAGVIAWKECMTKFFGIEPQFEFMRRQPFMVPRWLLQAFRCFCWHRHKMSVEDYVMSQETFSEWNVLGFYAWLYHRESFHWINTETDELPELTVKQYWSRTPIDAVRADIEDLLGGNGAVVEHVPNATQAAEVVEESEPTFTPENGSIAGQLMALADAETRKQADKERMAKLRARRGKKKAVA